jgi:hypothetical protein
LLRCGAHPLNPWSPYSQTPISLQKPKHRLPNENTKLWYTHLLGILLDGYLIFYT